MTAQHKWLCLIVDPGDPRRTTKWPVTAPTEAAARSLLKAMGMTVASCQPLKMSKAPQPLVIPEVVPQVIRPAVVGHSTFSLSNNAALIAIAGCMSVGLLITVLCVLTSHPEPVAQPQHSTTWVPPTAPARANIEYGSASLTLAPLRIDVTDSQPSSVPPIPQPIYVPPYAVMVNGVPSEVMKDGTVVPYGTLNQFGVPRTNWVRGSTHADGTTNVPYLRGSPHVASAASPSGRSH